MMGGGGVGEGGMGGLMASFLGGSDLGTLQHVVSAGRGLTTTFTQICVASAWGELEFWRALCGLVVFDGLS